MTEWQKLLESSSLIEQKLKYYFKDKTTLALAFVHSSYINENKDIVCQSNERLEFLGDAVLGILIADYLYKHLESCPEGQLSYFRSRLIEASTCSKYLEKLEVDAYILMGKGEKKNFISRKHPSILADLFEAIIGAIYLDGGIGAAKDFLFEHFLEDIQKTLSQPLRNWKAELQDYTQKKHQKIPVYKVTEEVGPDHSKTFQVSVFVDEIKMGSGFGSSKKTAQQAAASEALYQLNLSEPVQENI